MFHLTSKLTLCLIRQRLEITLWIVWALRATLLVGFMIITPSMKPQQTPKTKSQTLRASAGASQCEEKVKKGSRHVTGCSSCFYDYDALRLAAKLYSCKFDCNRQFIHHFRYSVNTYLLQLAPASSHCGEKHQIHSLNYIL